MTIETMSSIKENPFQRMDGDNIDERIIGDRAFIALIRFSKYEELARHLLNSQTI